MMKTKSTELFLIISFALMIAFSHGLSAKDLSRNTVRQVQRSYQLQQDNKVNQAIKLLADFSPKQGYDRAYVNRMLGNLYWQTEQQKLAIKRLTLAVDSKELSEEQQTDTLRMLADILLIEGEYKLAETRYKSMVSHYQKPVDLEWLWFRVAQAQYQQNKWASVEQSVDKQQIYQKKAGLKPKITPLKMKLAAQVARKRYKSAIITTRAIRELEPENILWWKQLTSLYINTDNHRQALVTLQQTERSGFEMSKQQLELMAQLYAKADVPVKAAEIYERLSDRFDSVEFTVQSARFWQVAKEWSRAERSWNKAASMEPKYNREYAQLCMSLRKYKKALDAINKFPEQDSNILLTKASVLNALGNNKEALKVATLAHNQRQTDASLNWVKYLSNLQ